MYQSIIREFQMSTNKDIPYIVNTLQQISSFNLPIQIIQICRALGILIYPQDLRKFNLYGYMCIDGELKPKLGSDKIISVNEYDSAAIRRMIVAYELGQYLFNFNPNEDIEFLDKVPNQRLSPSEKGKLPYNFALALLLPQDIFTASWQQSIKQNIMYDTVQELAEKFLVPPICVHTRARQENLL